ncbi:putative thioredoxin-like 2 variant 3, partial [Ramicandelaber brevisporus]
LYFWADFAAQCKQIDAVAAELAAKHPNLTIVRIAAEDHEDIAEAHEISAVPTVVFVRNGAALDRVEGANATELARLAAKYAPAAATTTASNTASPSASSPESAPAVDLNTRLSELIRRAPLMIFIKGTPAAPRCGFSRQLVSLLQNGGYKFGYFDILSDESVRQGLKEYSQWPTYPQLYANGELQGGLDIVRELIESGEFASMVPAES